MDTPEVYRLGCDRSMSHKVTFCQVTYVGVKYFLTRLVDEKAGMITPTRNHIEWSVATGPGNGKQHYDPGHETSGGEVMDERVTRLKTPEECEQFALNVQVRLPDLAQAARRRAVELRAAAHGVATTAEGEALAAVYAYERVLSQKRGKKIRASRTWQMIERHGIIGAVERAVNRHADPAGYTALAEMGMQDLAFEAVVVRHPEVFSQDAVASSTKRLGEWAGQE